MKKNLLSLMMVCCLSVMGVQAQNNVEGINVKTAPDFVSMVAANRATTDGVWLTYAPEELTEITAVGIGMGFSWGSMFPASMLTEFAGATITSFAFVDSGDPAYEGDYEVRIYLGGETQGETMVCQEPFHISGTQGSIVEYPLSTPIGIDGTQNLWVMFYQDGSLEYPAPAMGDMGDPNNRWIAVDGYGWMDLATVGGEGYSWLVWAYADGYDMIGENADEVAIYPNPTTGNVTVSATGMNHISVFNGLGQMVYDAPASSHLETLDMSQYQAGVYVVRVATENGVSVKRVTVM